MKEYGLETLWVAGRRERGGGGGGEEVGRGMGGMGGERDGGREAMGRGMG